MAAAVTLALALTGCGVEQVISGVGAAIDAANKINEGRMTELTSNEVLQLNKAIRQVQPEVPLLTETQATGLVKLIQENDVDSIAEAQTLIQQAENDPESITIPDELGGSLQALEDMINNYQSA